MLRTVRIPNELVGSLSDWLQLTREDGEPLPLDLCAWQGLHAFLGHLAFGVDQILGMECLALLGVDQDGEVFLFH